MLTHHRIILLVERVHLLLVVVIGVLAVVGLGRESFRRVILSLLLASRRTLRLATGHAALLRTVSIGHASHLVVILGIVRHSGCKILVEVGSVSIELVAIRCSRVLVGEAIDGVIGISLSSLRGSTLREFARGVVSTGVVVL